jgi:hypothetical protein
MNKIYSVAIVLTVLMLIAGDIWMNSVSSSQLHTPSEITEMLPLLVSARDDQTQDCLRAGNCKD